MRLTSRASFSVLSIAVTLGCGGSPPPPVSAAALAAACSAPCADQTATVRVYRSPDGSVARLEVIPAPVSCSHPPTTILDADGHTVGAIAQRPVVAGSDDQRQLDRQRSELLLGLQSQETIDCPAAPPTATSARNPAVPSDPPPRDPPPSAPRPAITSVSITVLPAEGGQAFCIYAVDGTVTGGHLSGDSPPFVHQDSGRIEPDALAAIFAAAQAVIDDPPGSATAAGPGTQRIEIAQGTAVYAYDWPFRTPAPDPRIATLEQLLMEHRIGAW